MARPNEHTVYRIGGASSLLWKTWDGEAIVFNPASGDTHRLDLVASAGLRCLESQALSAAGLRDALSRRLEVPADDNLLEYADRLLNDFTELGLIEPVQP
ncbi:MAG: HPr-rel-A system PqqD family peptide chaperone [Vicinamibacterales bacterium]